MAVNKMTWYLLGLANGSDEGALGFAAGWQYDNTWTEVVRNINGPGSNGDISLNRAGDVKISDAIKDASTSLYQAGVLFILGEWRDTTQALGGKFEWIGRGESGGEQHDVSSQNIVRKLEDPVGKTMKSNYWYEHGAPRGPHVVSNLLKKTEGDGGVIVCCQNSDGSYYTAYKWKDIPDE